MDSVLMWLAEGDRVFVRAGCNAFPPGSRSACCHLLVPDKQVLVVPDTAADPRCSPSLRLAQLLFCNFFLEKLGKVA